MQYLWATFLSLCLLTLGWCNDIRDTAPTVPDDTTPPAVISDTRTTDIMDDSEDAAALNLSTLQINSNGTEPFWNFMASWSNLVFQEPSMSGPITSTSYGITMTQTPTTIMINGSGFSALLTLQNCSDGMSDLVYAYKSVVTKWSDTLIGCANIIL